MSQLERTYDESPEKYMNDSSDTINNSSLDATIINKFKEVLERQGDEAKHVYFPREMRRRQASTTRSAEIRRDISITSPTTAKQNYQELINKQLDVLSANINEPEPEEIPSSDKLLNSRTGFTESPQIKIPPPELSDNESSYVKSNVDASLDESHSPLMAKLQQYDPSEDQDDFTAGLQDDDSPLRLQPCQQASQGSNRSYGSPKSESDQRSTPTFTEDQGFEFQDYLDEEINEDDKHQEENDRLVNQLRALNDNHAVHEQLATISEDSREYQATTVRGISPRDRLVTISDLSQMSLLADSDADPYELKKRSMISAQQYDSPNTHKNVHADRSGEQTELFKIRSLPYYSNSMTCQRTAYLDSNLPSSQNTKVNSGEDQLDLHYQEQDVFVEELSDGMDMDNIPGQSGNSSSQVLDGDASKSDLLLSFNLLDFGDDLDLLNSPMISPHGSFVKGVKNPSVVSQNSTKDLAQILSMQTKNNTDRLSFRLSQQKLNDNSDSYRLQDRDE